MMRKKILLIEGDHSLRRRYAKFLEWDDFEVLSAGDQQSLDQVLSEPPDHLDLVVFSPWSSNGECGRMIDALSRQFPCQKLLVLPEFPLNAPLWNGFEQVEKPLHPERLVLQVKRLLNIRSQG